MEDGLVTLVGLLVIYSPLALIGLVVGFAVFAKVAPLLATKPH